jgi:hypothetical protein
LRFVAVERPGEREGFRATEEEVAEDRRLDTRLLLLLLLLLRLLLLLLLDIFVDTRLRLLLLLNERRRAREEADTEEAEDGIAEEDMAEGIERTIQTGEAD